MSFTKAVWALLFFTARFSVCLNLVEPESNLRKRTEFKSPGIIAEELEQLVRIAVGEALSGQQQFSYIYIQPWESEDLIFDDIIVKEALSTDSSIELPQEQNVWPLSPENTNFRIAFSTSSDEFARSYADAEYPLLANKSFVKMVTSFKRNHSCPRYVILYSALLPCIHPAYQLGSPGTHCSEVTARGELKNVCNEAVFYLYTSGLENAQYEDAFKDTEQYFKDNGIMWNRII